MGGGNSSIFSNQGRWIVNGTVIISGGCLIAITREGKLITGHDVYLGPLTKVMCENEIIFGRRIRVSWECQFFDTDFHYLIIDRTVRRKTKGIFIDDYCWIGNRVSVMKGSKLGKYTVVASNSLLNKDYSEFGDKAILAGSPAKFKASGARMVCVPAPVEKEIADYFITTGLSSEDIDSDHFKQFISCILK